MLHQKKNLLDAALVCALFAVAFFYFQYGSFYLDLGTYHYDEGIAAYGALSILKGGIPYRDFWTLYAPGEFYLLAVIFKLFGVTLETARISAVFILSLSVCGIYSLINRLTSRVSGILAFTLSLGWLKSYMVYNRPGQPAILIFILCAFLLINFIESGKRRWLFGMGLLIGLIGLFRQDFGLYVFVAAILTVLFIHLNYRQADNFKCKLKAILISQSVLLCAALAAILPALIYLFISSAFKEFINDTVIFPLMIYPKVRDLPFPQASLRSLIFYLPPIIFLLTVVRLLFSGLRGNIRGRTAWLETFFLLTGAGLFNYTNTRTHMSHLLPTMIPAIMIFSIFFNSFVEAITGKLTRPYKGLAGISAVLICVVFLSYLTKPGFEIYAKPPTVFSSAQKIEGQLNIGRARRFYDDPFIVKSLTAAVSYIRSHTSDDEFIFVANLRHDKVVNSDTMFYFFSERFSATKYYELHPGLTNTLTVQKEIIRDLIKANVRYIVAWSGSKLKVDEPNDSGKSSGIFELDEFIKDNYRLDKDFGSYVILKKEKSAGL